MSSINLETNDGVQGLKGEYFNNPDLQGEPIMVKIDDQIDFNWDNSTPSPKLKNDEFSLRWTGYLIPSEDGEHQIGCGAKSEIKVFIDDELMVTSIARHNMFYRENMVDFEKGRKYKIKVEYIDKWGDAQAELVWSKPGDALRENAVKLAKSSDVVILALGLTKRTEGEQLRIEVEGYHLLIPFTNLRTLPEFI